MMRTMVAAIGLWTGGSGAQQATGGGALDLEQVPQSGRKADQIRRNLQRVRLPPGFGISLYAVVPDARHMAMTRNNANVFVGTRKTNLYVVVDRDKDRVADEVKRFAPAVRFTQPHPCYSPDGFLCVVEHNRVLVFPAAEFFFEGPDVAVETVVPRGQLIPTEEESFNHGHRVCRIGPDNKLYVSLGQPFNVQPREKLEAYDRLWIGGIVRMDRDGRNREVFARGIRNSVGIAFHPQTRDLWFTDNRVDGMGDNAPPGEINRATAAGQHFGLPCYGGGKVRTTDYAAVGEAQIPANRPPEVGTTAHAADLGLAFCTGRAFPERYRGGLFSAQRGSWNRTAPAGGRVMFTPMKPDGSGVAGETEVFASGWLDDDTAGAIYRIAYAAP